MPDVSISMQWGRAWNWTIVQFDGGFLETEIGTILIPICLTWWWISVCPKWHLTREIFFKGHGYLLKPSKDKSNLLQDFPELSFEARRKNILKFIFPNNKQPRNNKQTTNSQETTNKQQTTNGQQTNKQQTAKQQQQRNYIALYHHNQIQVQKLSICYFRGPFVNHICFSLCFIFIVSCASYLWSAPFCADMCCGNVQCAGRGLGSAGREKGTGQNLWEGIGQLRR